MARRARTTNALIAVCACGVTALLIGSYFVTLPSGDLGERKASQFVEKCLQEHFCEFGALPSTLDEVADRDGLLGKYRNQYRVTFAVVEQTEQSVEVVIHVNDCPRVATLRR